MNTYYLKVHDGRVVLEDEPRRGEILRVITAESWLDARFKIHEFEFPQKPGYGYLPE